MVQLLYQPNNYSEINIVTGICYWGADFGKGIRSSLIMERYGDGDEWIYLQKVGSIGIDFAFTAYAVLGKSAGRCTTDWDFSSTGIRSTKCNGSCSKYVRCGKPGGFPFLCLKAKLLFEWI